MVDLRFFGKFLVKYEIDFLTRGNFIEGYIATASIYDSYLPISRTFVMIPFSPYWKYSSPNVSSVELIPNAIGFRHNFMVDFRFFGKFFVKYEIDFLTRGNFIEGYIATASIYAIFTPFPFQFKLSHSSFTYDDWTIMNLV